MASVNSRADLFPNRAFTPISGSDEAMEEDPEWQARMPLKPRHHSSYENMNGQGGQGFVDDPNHQYEDPGRLTQQSSFRGGGGGRGQRPLPGKPSPRRKMNDAYEPVRSKQRKRTFTDESYDSDNYYRINCGKLTRFVAFIALLLALAAVVVVLLILLGVLSVPGCHECKKELVPVSEESSSGLSQDVWRVIKELRSNVSALQLSLRRKDEIISELQRRDTEHADRIVELEKKANYRVIVSNGTNVNISELVGPRGPPGIPGPAGERGNDGADGKDGKRGERGPGNMTLCRYVRKESTAFTADERGNGMNVAVNEPDGSRILGVTCSTHGTTEYNLKSQLVGRLRQYECECRGRSILFPINGPNSGEARCYIHYWICPLIS